MFLNVVTLQRKQVLLSLVLAYILSLLTAYLTLSAQPSSFIHLDQFGYISDAVKVSVLSNPTYGYNASQSYQPGSLIEVRSLGSDAVVYSAAPLMWNNGNIHGQSGDEGWWFDFSAVTDPGTYYLVDPTNNEKSGPFQINDNPYQEVLVAAWRALYYNRCNAVKEVPYAETGWIDGLNFLHPLQDANCRYVYDATNAGLEKDLSGGWFDAGDYNKYVTFAHHPVHQLLWSYEENPSLYGDDWNWPESGNGLPDVLDEIKWEIDWLMKMTNADGSVHIKMGSISHSENASAPPSVNTDQRYYGPTCTSASVAAASMLAHAAKVFASQSGLQSYAQTLQDRAIACWSVFKIAFDANQLETNCDDGTIKAGDADRDATEQRDLGITAAVYLYQLTSAAVYHDFIKAQYDQTEPIANGWLSPYRTDLIEALFLYTTLPNADPAVVPQIENAVPGPVNSNNDGFYALGTDDLYRAAAPDWMYHWGSNMPKANTANLCQIIKKYNFVASAHSDLTEKAAEQLHYFHGVNPQGLVYLSNMYRYGGDRCVNEIYHTWFNDGTQWDHAINSPIGPAPGFVSGGANKDFSVGGLSPPSNQPPQKSYLDFNTGWPDNSWEISEPAIYYQAAYIRLLANYVNTQTVTSDMNLSLSKTCIRIHPNPSNGIYYISGILDNYTLEIYDEGGMLHQNIPYVGSQTAINLSNLPNGTFLVKVENKDNDMLCVQKIIKQ
ncbi:MAG: T9SS type A sorting domain-containing protein [Saprospiraceae bacterium]|nr:T9SS type A sorting domain-containing protein [Saprospiraceae bacterium]